MSNIFARVLNDQSHEVRSKIIAMYAILVALNVVAWGLTFIVSLQYAVVLGSGLLAFTFWPASRSGCRPHSRH